ncbi:spore germination protein [Propionispora hippei]|uniref:Spore germination protein KA n=1 Tax=Propionispora hippei DSM 15287 TaxID=1123003 RepID=A0A1M6KBG5_9FIRM|nr:spore germination protein [Propionispora hippei]SHJ56232.1 spore germination protein KA [Propionispora hippei DSM 15287]
MVLQFTQSANTGPEQKADSGAAQESACQVSPDIRANQKQLREVFDKSQDIIFRDFAIPHLHREAFLCFINGMADVERIDQYILQPLMQKPVKGQVRRSRYRGNCLQRVKKDLLGSAGITETNVFQEVARQLLAGNTAVFIDRSPQVLIVHTEGFSYRAIEEPGTETVVRGSREGFTENITVNITMLRRRVRNTDLVVEKMQLGEQTNTNLVIAYLENLANPELVAEVKKRIQQIKIDAVLDSGYVEQYIEDQKYSIFSTVGSTEKPDVVAGKLLEGRVAVFCDGTPFVLTVPFLFIESLQSSEDYYLRPIAASFMRLIRVFSLLMTIALPALYVTVSMYHYEMVPTILLITMAATREGIPFPPFLEAFIMGIAFEIIREAGIRMPRPVGQAISIVGALVLGETAVNAGVVSSPMVIVVAITAITDFVNPSLTTTTVFLRIFLLALAAVLGLYGILIGFFFILAHICSLRSFGAPYLSPLAPVNRSGLKDTLIRSSLWLMKQRPSYIQWKHSRRRGE